MEPESSQAIIVRLRAENAELKERLTAQEDLACQMAAEAADEETDNDSDQWALMELLDDGTVLNTMAPRFLRLAKTRVFPETAFDNLAKLLARDDLDTKTEEETLEALGPWFKDQGRSVKGVLKVLSALRCAWLPFQGLARLAEPDGPLAQLSQDARVKQKVSEMFEIKVKALSQTDAVDLVCPITHELFERPMVASDGHTYEHDALMKHFASPHGNRSPLTNEPLIRGVMRPNVTLRKIVDNHWQENACIRKRQNFTESSPPRETLIAELKRRRRV
eukprot:CAMPEP_0181200700 /NCGR_PEP_ID=MMETSP1096-20121128/17910_1 /TAXON_ID=156174 ORGANISM="Chrysochromulina ericina, Strain CCMP281" /NCGR_SAMPLE_ID=MMETSP1096 /ASSEMBLY_ACC=CAM_ASM_000453 /LENGTH=276 /DNA_ID=CAMNT_0023291087 /DNA_START=48 /DNA_END=879 /DNA_ORIENTATION=+